MIKRLILILAALILAMPAHADDGCAARAEMTERLQDLYQETLVAGGLQDGVEQVSMMEIYASTETGTYTVIVTSAEGLSCIVATGTDYFVLQEATSAGLQL